MDINSSQEKDGNDGAVLGRSCHSDILQSEVLNVSWLLAPKSVTWSTLSQIISAYSIIFVTALVLQVIAYKEIGWNCAKICAILKILLL